jgi:hypothetical protein
MEDKSGKTILIGTGQMGLAEGKDGIDCEIPIALDCMTG